jgi:hypothetical protein
MTRAEASTHHYVRKLTKQSDTNDTSVFLTYELGSVLVIFIT